ADEFHHATLEEDPAIGLVRVVSSGYCIEINAIPAEETIVSDEEYANIRSRTSRGVNVERKLLDPERDANFCRQAERLKTELVEVDLPMPRHDDADSGAEFLQLRGQGIDDIGKAANLRVRGGFSCRHHDVKRPAHRHPFTSSRARTVAFTTALINVVR